MLEQDPLSFDLSPDRRLLVTAEEYSTVRIYDLYHQHKVWEYLFPDEVKQVKWVSTAGTIFVQTISNVKVVHLFLNFSKY